MCLPFFSWEVLLDFCVCNYISVFCLWVYVCVCDVVFEICLCMYVCVCMFFSNFGWFEVVHFLVVFCLRSSGCGYIR